MGASSIEQPLQSIPDRRWILFSATIFTRLCFRERVLRVMDFFFRQGKTVPVEGVYIVVLDRHRALF